MKKEITITKEELSEAMAEATVQFVNDLTLKETNCNKLSALDGISIIMESAVIESILCKKLFGGEDEEHPTE